jgi:hypothetical protein
MTPAGRDKFIQEAASSLGHRIGKALAKAEILPFNANDPECLRQKPECAGRFDCVAKPELVCRVPEFLCRNHRRARVETYDAAGAAAGLRGVGYKYLLGLAEQGDECYAVSRVRHGVASAAGKTIRKPRTDTVIATERMPYADEEAERRQTFRHVRPSF